ncbi:hypothetical protein A2Z33_06720 [Candidatus Gottesmanbacteria bacterium RBG_16_52_11]|uniref:Uncharacterized protein n=1 Tax=Candidatus Gottesmanbacteria bacterium RBG_16_52_11 TaxID=1798374 RepID=A0A1F5YYB3_9BACT|nr:MAG: hypothetical protein A2Z33_06720 [Candidatus Gottesmanbacteria bacterium RBG_16_52_11]
MRLLSFFILLIPLFLLRLGSFARHLIDLVTAAVYSLVRTVLSLLKSAFRRIRQASRKFSKNAAETEGRQSFRALAGVYAEGFRESVRFFIRPLKPVTAFFSGLIRKRNRLRNLNGSVVFTKRGRKARQIVLYPAPLTVAWSIRSFFAGMTFSLIFIFLPLAVHSFVISLPQPQLLTSRNIPVTTKIFDRNGELLYEIYADENRTPRILKEIPQYLQQATIAIEDKDFYNHQGFSMRGIGRAVREITVNHTIQGGSTITQQLVKSALLTPEITLERKVKELILAFWAERIYSKRQILEMYLNQVPYGGTSWGIEAASQMYFGKPVTQLSLAESALLAGLPAAPSEFSPFGPSPEKALARQREVLRRMTEDGYITENQAAEARSQKLTFVQPLTGIKAPHFVMYIRNLLEREFGVRAVARGGLRVKTSLDLGLQEMAERIVRSRVDELQKLDVGNGAALVTNPKTGEILAMVGSRDYFDTGRDGNVNVTTSLRQPGSSIKVVTYTAALERGFTAASIIDDTAVTYRTDSGQLYTPVNYDGRYHGPTPLRYALANSYNIPAVKVLDKVGIQAMIEKGRLMGIKSWDDTGRFGLSLTLGGGDVTMLDMAAVYGSLANGGKRSDPHPVIEVMDYTGRILLKRNNPDTVAATTPEVAWIISSILSDNSARTESFGSNSSLIIPGKTVPVKTGTSNEKRDNWCVGYTPTYVVTVWVGNNDNRPMNPVLTSGVTGASPIWHDIMTELLKDRPDETQPRPDGITSIPCYNGREEYFVKGTETDPSRCKTLPRTPESPTPAPR